MMGFEIRGLTEIMGAFTGLDGALDGTVSEIVQAQGDIVAAEQKKTARAMLQGPYNKEAVANAVTKGKLTSMNGTVGLSITFEGTQHGNRLAEIAFVNEFGKTNQDARPFIETANQQCADALEKKAMDILDKKLQSNGL